MISLVVEDNVVQELDSKGFACCFQLFGHCNVILAGRTLGRTLGKPFTFSVSSVPSAKTIEVKGVPIHPPIAFTKC